jgi:hypothetical protein
MKMPQAASKAAAWLNLPLGAGLIRKKNQVL